nr:hypothetical protein [uncultured Campylobacter sp.]
MRGSKLSPGLFGLASFSICKFDESCQGSVKFDLKFTIKNGGKFQIYAVPNLTPNLPNFKNPRSNLLARFTLF